MIGIYLPGSSYSYYSLEIPCLGFPIRAPKNCPDQARIMLNRSEWLRELPRATLQGSLDAPSSAPPRFVPTYQAARRQDVIAGAVWRRIVWTTKGLICVCVCDNLTLCSFTFTLARQNTLRDMCMCMHVYVCVYVHNIYIYISVCIYVCILSLDRQIGRLVDVDIDMDIDIDRYR